MQTDNSIPQQFVPQQENFPNDQRFAQSAAYNQRMLVMGQPPYHVYQQQVHYQQLVPPRQYLNPDSMPLPTGSIQYQQYQQPIYQQPYQQSQQTLPYTNTNQYPHPMHIYPPRTQYQLPKPQSVLPDFQPTTSTAGRNSTNNNNNGVNNNNQIPLPANCFPDQLGQNNFQTATSQAAALPGPSHDISSFNFNTVVEPKTRQGTPNVSIIQASSPEVPAFPLNHLPPGTQIIIIPPGDPSGILSALGRDPESDVRASLVKKLEAEEALKQHIMIKKQEEERKMKRRDRNRKAQQKSRQQQKELIESLKKELEAEQRKIAESAKEMTELQAVVQNITEKHDNKLDNEDSPCTSNDSNSELSTKRQLEDNFYTSDGYELLNKRRKVETGNKIVDDSDLPSCSYQFDNNVDYGTLCSKQKEDGPTSEESVENEE